MTQASRQMLKLILPVVIGLSVSQINMFVTQYLATGLDGGMLTALQYGQPLYAAADRCFCYLDCGSYFPHHDPAGFYR